MVSRSTAVAATQKLNYGTLHRFFSLCDDVNLRRRFTLYALTNECISLRNVYYPFCLFPNRCRDFCA